MLSKDEGRGHEHSAYRTSVKSRRVQVMTFISKFTPVNICPYEYSARSGHSYSGRLASEASYVPPRPPMTYSQQASQRLDCVAYNKRRTTDQPVRSPSVERSESILRSTCKPGLCLTLNRDQRSRPIALVFSVSRRLLVTSIEEMKSSIKLVRSL